MSLKTGLLIVIALLLGGILTFLVISRRQDHLQAQRDREVEVCAAKAYKMSPLVSQCLRTEYGWDLLDAIQTARERFPPEYEWE